jgi:hypothetical protein
MRELEVGQVIEYHRGDDQEKAIVLAPALVANHWQVANLYDDNNGGFTIVAERDMQPATLDADEQWFGDLIAGRLLG